MLVPALTAKDVIAFLKKDASRPVTLAEFQEMWKPCSTEERLALISGLPAPISASGAPGG